MKSIKAFRLARIIGLIDDDLVTESAGIKKRYLHRILRWSSMAAVACLCIVIIGAVALFNMRMGGAGSAAPENGSAVDAGAAPPPPADAPPAEMPTGDDEDAPQESHSSGGCGVAEGSDESPDPDAFQYYLGPILPLTFAGDCAGLSAERAVTLDFSPYILKTYTEEYEGELRSYEKYESKCLVTDNYMLTNNTNSTRKLTALYPIVGCLAELNSMSPRISVGGEAVDWNIHYGLTVGVYQELFCGREFGAGIFEDWAECRDILSGEYKTLALSEAPKLDERVVVYELSNEAMPEEYDDAVVAMRFTIDSTKTQIMSCDVDGYANEGGGALRYDYFVPSWQAEREPMLVVFGEDIGDYSLQGYKNGACNEGDEIDIKSYVTRREMTLDELLKKRCAYWANTTYEDGIYGSRADFGKMLYEAARWNFATELDMDRGAELNLDNIISSAHQVSRVMYLAVELEIPAGESVELETSFTKSASFDYRYWGSEDLRHGYDLATGLGSDLSFTSQSVTLEDRDTIEIVNQNFGFDIENGAKTVELDLDTERYYIEIVRKEQNSG